MKKVTKQDRVDRVIRNWEHQYPEETRAKDKDDILQKLKSEDPLTEQRVNEIIGNNTWTSLRCDSCGDQVEELVRFDCLYEEVFNVCKKCLNEAITLIQ